MNKTYVCILHLPFPVEADIRSGFRMMNGIREGFQVDFRPHVLLFIHTSITFTYDEYSNFD